MTPRSTHAFFRFLMARDVAGKDWINSRPATAYAQQMVAMNMTYEHQFFKQLVMRRSAIVGRQQAQGRSRQAEASKRISLDALYMAFNTWLSANHVRYETSHLKFGVRLSKLVWNEEKRTGLRHFSKARLAAGITYCLDVPALEGELRTRGWISEDDAGEGDWGIEDVERRSPAFLGGDDNGA